MVIFGWVLTTSGMCIYSLHMCELTWVHRYKCTYVHVRTKSQSWRWAPSLIAPILLTEARFSPEPRDHWFQVVFATQLVSRPSVLYHPNDGFIGSHHACPEFTWAWRISIPVFILVGQALYPLGHLPQPISNSCPLWSMHKSIPSKSCFPHGRGKIFLKSLSSSVLNNAE